VSNSGCAYAAARLVSASYETPVAHDALAKTDAAAAGVAAGSRSAIPSAIARASDCR
jgi:hypothetical protein